MKIESGRPVNGASGARKTSGAAAAPSFAPSVEAPARGAAIAPTAPLTPLDSILALQAEESPTRRRGRQARRGRDALDALERLEEGLLSGCAPMQLKNDLERLARGGELTGEPGLDAILNEIDIRLAVELAKLERLVSA